MGPRWDSLLLLIRQGGIPSEPKEAQGNAGRRPFGSDVRLGLPSGAWISCFAVREGTARRDPAILVGSCPFLLVGKYGAEVSDWVWVASSVFGNTINNSSFQCHG